MDPADGLTPPPDPVGANSRGGCRHRLAALADIPDGDARGFAVDLGRTRRTVIVLRTGDAVTGFVDACPHMGVPLPWRGGGYLTNDGRFLRCVNHGALFDHDGLCVFGPCKGQRLTPQRLEIVDGDVWLIA